MEIGMHHHEKEEEQHPNKIEKNIYSKSKKDLFRFF